MRKRIILVDDVNYHLLSVRERLKKYYEVYTAQTCERLFELLQGIKPDLILLDINMPEIDGYEIIKRLKDDPRYKEIPVIFFTANKDKKSAVKGLSLGAVDFITKPIEDDYLLDSIDNQLDSQKRGAIKPIIVAVDDSPSILESINNALHNLYEIRTLSTPENLKDLLKLVEPDLFILDYQMPKLTGFDLVPIIRNFQIHEETPIVFLTSEATRDHVAAANLLGASDFLVKPINVDILRAKVALHLQDFLVRRHIRVL